MIPLAVFEEIIDASGVAPRIEAMLPMGVRPRQLKVRTLLAGMCLAQADHRPAHLTRVHQALTGLSDDDQRRLGVVADWKHGPHLLTYRQAERTSGLVAAALGKDEPDGLPSQALQAVCDDLLEASVPGEFKDASTSLAVDWTDMESFSRPPPARGADCADPEASWGHRKNNLLRREDELFFGYYLSAAIMMPGENGPAIPEFARRAIVSSCRHDPVRALVPVLTAMPSAGIPLGDVLADSGYAHRDAAAWALPLRDAGASLVQDLHPHDRGPKGTHDGAIISNGNLMGIWQATRYASTGRQALRADRGACPPGSRLNGNRPQRPSTDRRDLVTCGGGWRRVTQAVNQDLILAWRSGTRRRPPPQPRDTPTGLWETVPLTGMGGRGRCHPQEPTPHSDGSPRAPARTGALRAAGVTNG